VAVLALALVASPVRAGQIGHDRHVVIVIREDGDPRLDAAREALEFWNTTLSDLGIKSRLFEDQVLVAPPMTRALENYTRKIWLLAGRSVPRGEGPQPPVQLIDVGADIVMFLSNQTFFSFAWPIAERTRYFIGIQTDRVDPLTYPNVTRNVIAHELGHALGLEHNGNTRTLMCGPCEHLLYWAAEPVFFPLTPGDRGRLRRLDSSP
jgi:hypothetical protein